MAGRRWNARKAYYEAVMELGVARDTMQLRIGEYLAAAQHVERELASRGVSQRIMDRFHELRDMTTRHLTDDLTGEEPDDKRQ